MEPNQQPLQSNQSTPGSGYSSAIAVSSDLSGQPVVPQVPVATTPPPKKRKGLIIACVAIGVLFMLALVGVLLMRNKHASSPKPQPEQASTTQQTTELTDVIGLADNVTVLERPTVTLPSAADGWQADTTLTAGTVGVVHSNGCKLNYVPVGERASENITDDGAATEAAFNRKLDSLKATGSVTELVYGTMPMTLAGTPKKIEFKTANMTYSTSLTSYRLAMTGRVINGYPIGFNFYCPRSVFSSDLNDKALSGVTINLKTKESLQ